MEKERVFARACRQEIGCVERRDHARKRLDRCFFEREFDGRTSGEKGSSGGDLAFGVVRDDRGDGGVGRGDALDKVGVVDRGVEAAFRGLAAVESGRVGGRVFEV